MRIIVLLVLAITGGVHGAPPAIDGIFPSCSKAGGRIEAQVSGKANPWPPDFWSTNPAVRIEPGEKSPAVAVVIDKGAEPGPCWIRAYNDEGTSEPFLFLVEEQNCQLHFEDEKQPNEKLEQAVVLEPSLPMVLCGRLKSRDVDCFQIKLEKGKTFHAWMESYAFRNGNDPMLHLYDELGEQVAFAHDNAINLDPHLTFDVERSGKYTLAAMAIATPPNANVSFHGSDKGSYRIQLTTDRSDLAARMLPEPGQVDAELNKLFRPPFSIFGTIQNSSGIDRVRFSVDGKQRLRIEANSYCHRFPTDPVLRVLKPDGSLIREVDDVKPTRDASYVYTFPSAGEYTVEIRDRFRRSGEDFRYELGVGPEVPDYHATVDQHSYQLRAGDKVEIPLKITRENGDERPLEVRVEGLPALVVAKPANIPAKTGTVDLVLSCPKEVKAFSGPVRIEILEKQGSGSKVAVYSWQNKDARGPYLLDEIEQIWLTILPDEGKVAEDTEKKAK